MQQHVNRSVLLSGQRGKPAISVLIASMLAVLILASPTPVAATDATPIVYGKTIGNWGLAWWQWAVRFSSENNPITQTGAVDCAAGQSGKVWFLAGTFGTSAVRSCSVKAGKALFLGLFNGLFWFPEDCQRPNGCRAKVAAGVDAVTNWTCTIDGKPCIYTNQVVRDQSDPLPITFPPHSFVVTDFKYSPGRRDFAIADGYWVMLEPLAVGPHTIRFTSAAPGGFALDVTFNLTVTP